MRKSLLVKLMSLMLVLFVVTSCGDDGTEDVSPTEETCSDGIQNQDETGVDCGGVCDACVSVEPTPTRDFYVKFKVDGEWKIYQHDYGYYFCGLEEATWCLNDVAISIGMDYANGPYNQVPSDYENMEGMEYGFDHLRTDLEWGALNSWDYEYSTDYASGSYGSITVNSVDRIAQFYNEFGDNGDYYYYYVVEGIFNCKAAKEGGPDLEVTDGSFKVFFVGY